MTIKSVVKTSSPEESNLGQAINYFRMAQSRAQEIELWLAVLHEIVDFREGSEGSNEISQEIKKYAEQMTDATYKLFLCILRELGEYSISRYEWSDASYSAMFEKKFSDIESKP